MTQDFINLKMRMKGGNGGTEINGNFAVGHPWESS